MDRNSLPVSPCYPPWNLRQSTSISKNTNWTKKQWSYPVCFERVFVLIVLPLSRFWVAFLLRRFLWAWNKQMLSSWLQDAHDVHYLEGQSWREGQLVYALVSLRKFQVQVPLLETGHTKTERRLDNFWSWKALLKSRWNPSNSADATGCWSWAEASLVQSAWRKSPSFSLKAAWKKVPVATPWRIAAARAKRRSPRRSGKGRITGRITADEERMMMMMMNNHMVN